MLEAAVLRSSEPHARITKVDLAAAARAEGVVAVITADRFGDAYYHHLGGSLADRRPLARDVVRYVGEEIAAVAATTSAQARAAIGSIRVHYRRLPVVTEVEEALRPRAVRLHQRPSGGNVAARVEREYGNLEAARRRAVTTVSQRYRFGRQNHACMEPNGIVARWDAAEERLELWSPTQAPYFIRKEVAHVLGLAPGQIVMREIAVGGGFGSKSKISEHEVLAAALSIDTGRPVRLMLDRSEEFTATKCRHAIEVTLESGIDAEGRFTHRDAFISVDNGAYNHTGPSVMESAIATLASLYRVDAVRVVAQLVDTNKQPGGQFRGYGAPQATFAIESQVDELARAAGKDPFDIRILNANRPGDVTHSGWKLGSAQLAECLEKARELIGTAAGDAGHRRRRGTGVAASINVSGAYSYEGANRSEASIHVGPDGQIEVRFGGADTGTGQRTMLAQIAAEELAVEPEALTVVTMDGDQTPFDMGAWSSRGTTMGGHAVAAAARSAAAVLRRMASDKFNVDPAAVSLADGNAVCGDDRISYGDLAVLSGDADGVLRIAGEFVADTEFKDKDTGRANLSMAYSFAAHAVEVEVDTATGVIQVLRVVAVHDCGTPINPLAVEGQIVGGVVMGLGAAMAEDLLHEGGRSLTRSYLNYALPRAADVPPIHPVILQGADPAGPYGAKGVGEVSLSPTPAAVANAVDRAVGVRVRELPLTPDKVLRELRPVLPGGFRIWRRPKRWWVTLMRWAYPRGLHLLLHRLGTKLARHPAIGEVESFVRPDTLAAAATALEAPGAQVIGGGTDLLPARQDGLQHPRVLVDATSIGELREIKTREDGASVIGAAVTLAELMEATRETLPALSQTLGTIASPQIREMATVAGNLCQEKRCWFYRNGFDCYKRAGPTSPCYAVLGDNRFYHAVLGAHRCQAVTASDLATTLTALGGEVHVQGRGRSERRVPMEDFYAGPSETVLEPEELITAIMLPPGVSDRVTMFEKMNMWEGDFAIVSACVSLEIQGNRVVDSRVVLGSIAPTPYRATAVEAALTGCEISAASPDDLSRLWNSEAHPLPGNAWKVEAAGGLLARVLERCLS
jgi:CO/xanthine dehydrogenase Mo-binding subunit/CO/xanthine dehydrogenase FAD-binding subunit